ncbi:type IV pilus assembly protein PilM [Halanaerobium kushneri]|jgi:type IV pilus assembly protein PilM|uniref:Type IV pilus assembly protein PilM n=1 Tax=Halanaerobium kushneri TaxID=56779 RepID=A0A1N6Q7H4_9FIRM|nr:type IV pilus assembly protein PilM [Halanaerobium kushneri]SIQ12489.1 type IV pilus assembly protein PilM [Halanaerobium kushneri]
MFFKNNIYTCIDVGTYALKAAQIKNTRDKSFKILDTKLQKLPRDTIADGVIKDESLLAAEIKNILDQFKKKTNYIITAVPSNELLIRNIEMPKMDKKEIKESLKWEADEQIPYPVENAAIDFFKVEEDEDTVKYLISAVKKNIIDNLLAPFERNNIKVSVVNTQPMALISLLEYQNLCDNIIAVIDIGFSATQITIADKNNIYLSRTIDTGGNHFTQTLMEIQGNEYDAAEERKFEEGLGADETEDKNQQELIDEIQLDIALGEDNRLNELASTLSAELTRSFDYFNTRNRGQEITKVFITGGGSKLKGLRELLREDLDIEIIEIDPFINTNYAIKHDKYCEECKNELAVAIGLGVSEVIADED